jgi:thiol:disulfide interchange protein DsbA
VHPALFEALHEKRQKINDEAALQDFFVNHGVSAEDFRNTFGSFAVSVKLNNARAMTRRYAITGVPTIIINGKFSTGGRQAGSNANIIKVVDYLVAQERSGMVPVVKTTQP